MPVIGFTKDFAAATMVVESVWDHPVEAVWALWADPRKLEKWWGPPTYPATVVEHDLRPDGKVTYFMTGPEGDKHAGWWTIRSVEAPVRLELQDGFADEDGNPNAELPTTVMTVDVEPLPSGSTRMCMTSVFPSSDAMQEMLSFGMEEGLAGAMGQIEAVLAQA